MSISIQTEVLAQPIPVGDVREEQYRITQLLSDTTIANSFGNRSIGLDTYRKVLKSSGFNRQAWWNSEYLPQEKEIYPNVTLGTYDLILSNTHNSTLPYGENNGAAWYGRGHNTEFKGGFYLTSPYVTITFHPHIIYQENRDFEVPRFIPTYPDGSIRYVAEGVLPGDSLAERIDRPFRFGPDSYTTFDWGHSSIRLHYKAIEAGISTEPLWWGPGVQYALVMSNNAAGVPHAFINTRRPLHLPLDAGRVEFRWMMGLPKDSKYFDLNLEASPNVINRKEREMLLGNRLMQGLNVVYSPSFLKNFHIGFSRILHQYIPEECSINDPTPILNCDTFKIPSQKSQSINPLDIFLPFPKPDQQAYKGLRDESHYQDQNALSSIYFRWLWPESNTEIYGEYYREDHSRNFRDFLTEPQHARAYTFGAQTIIKSKFIDFFKVNIEINSLLPGRIDDVRPQTYYYTHKTVKQGHTNRGQVLGAAIGPGSTSQYLGIDGYFAKGKLGLFIQRMVDNDLFHYEYYQRYFPQEGFKDLFRHQVKLNIGSTVKYKFDNILLDGKIVWNKHFEYGRFNYGKLPLSWEGREKEDVINMQVQFSLRYLF